MAGLLAWAADVVGGHGNESNDEDDELDDSIVFTEDQQKYIHQLDSKSNSLSRSIQDLRLRLPPSDISLRLPHLHAHSLASNHALTLQLNAHSTTRQQVQFREETLQEEIAAYEKAISNCHNKLREKLLEADSLLIKLKELDEIEQNLRNELESAQSMSITSHSERSSESLIESENVNEPGLDTEASKSGILEKLESKKKELSSIEAVVQDLEKKWARIQDKALKLPTPAQREKALDKQLHSLIEQLAAKQAQAEGLVSEIHLKKDELERSSALWKRVEISRNADMNTARNRFGRSTSEKGFVSADYMSDSSQKLPYYAGDRNENQERLMLLRAAFVLYILALHILVFIKISF
ncbi:hypothetical protein ACFE04_010245 [Oxalis oulophora]